MNLDELRCFLVVAEELHMGRAAQRVHLSQPALSRLVSRMEHFIGTPLLDRSGAGLRLTPAGVSFADASAKIVDSFESAVLHARALSSQTRGGRRRRQLRVGVLFPAAAELTGPILTAYRRSSPDVDVQIMDIAGLDGEQALRSGQVDVAFLWSPVVGSGLSTVPLFHDRFALLVARNHRLAKSRHVEIEDVSDERYTITTSMSKAWQEASILASWRTKPRQALRVSTVTDAMQAIASGAAVSIGPTCLARFAPVTGVRYIPLQLDTRPLALLCRRSDDSESREFVDFAADVARRLAPLVTALPH